jgi:hypothetical protein
VSPAPPNQPDRLSVIETIIRRGPERTQSWAFCPFFASVFECTVSVNNIDRYTLSRFWPPGFDYDADAIALRTCLQTIDIDLYNSLHHSTGFYTYWQAHPHGIDQEVLLGQFAGRTTGGNRNPPVDNNVRYLMQIQILMPCKFSV